MGDIVFLYVCTRCGFCSEGDKCDSDEEAQIIFRNTVVGVNLDSKETDRKVLSQRICNCTSEKDTRTGQGVANLVGWTKGGVGCSKLL